MKKSSDAISTLDEVKASACNQIKNNIELIETISTTPKQIQFSLDMFEELQKLSCDEDTLSAALLYPCLNADNKKTIKDKTSSTVYNLLIGTERMEAIDQLKSKQASSLNNNQSDNLRKMLLAIVDDIRIVLIKLAERLATIRSLRAADDEQQKNAAKQVMDLYAPLANRLGIGQIKWQLEDWAFRFLDQKNYKAISKGLKMRRQDREDYINQVQAELEILIKKNKIERYELSGRAKHIYSIYKKTTRKQVSLDEIYDTSAFRILVPEVKDCYTMLSHVHEKWKPIAKEFDDYITKPKLNGYQSIHTAVIGPENINVEIQIRTFDMHDAAELGVAAHWKYKEGASTESHYENKISWLRQMMNWQKEVTQENIEQTNLYNKVFEDRVYVFTPNGDILDLPAGSTPLDFAYQVHTEVGHCCRGAKVDGNIVALSQRLKTGDKIEIMAAKTGGPSRDWLNPGLGYMASTSAKNKVKLWFRHKEHEKHLEDGKLLWEKIQRKEKINKAQCQSLLERFKYKSMDELYLALTKNELGPTTIKNHIHKTNEKRDANSDLIHSEKTGQRFTHKPKIAIEGAGNLLTMLARCCQPIPGDDIVGYITRGYGISIHRADCGNIKQSKERRPERIIDVSWGEAESTHYPVDLLVEATDRTGIIRDISTLLANENISMLGIQSRVNPLQNSVSIQMTLEVNDLEPLQKTIHQLKQLTDVISVVRKK